MKRTGLFPILFSLFLTIMSCSVSLGETDDPCDKPWHTPLSEVTGTVVGIHLTTPQWTQDEGLHLDIETSTGASVVIHVFPTDCIENNAPETFQFTMGELITATGSVFFTEANTQRNICAAKIAQRPELKLRTFKTGCLNEELCKNCQGFCQETCANSPKPDLCIPNCQKGCEADITPCADDETEYFPPINFVPTNFLLLRNL